jgi:DNA processing protein
MIDVAVTTSRIAEIMALAEAASPQLSTQGSHRIARVLAEFGADATLSAQVDEQDAEWLESLLPLPASRVEFWAREVDRLSERGIRVVAACEADYPANLSLIHNRPPLLFVRGEVFPSDRYAIAVVGTRDVSPAGAAFAGEMSRGLVAAGITVVSGLAAGVDTAAHSAALEAGGRTIAVFGTGIERVFPKANVGLAGDIIAAGACVSQFWPSQSGERWTFPLRNIVTSGLSLGTVVIEAGDSSGARLQAGEAVKHGRRLFLPEQLVDQQQWTRQLLHLPSVTVVSSVDEVVDALATDLAGAVGLATF